MNPVVDSILYNVVASIICDIGKHIVGQFNYKKVTFDEKDVETYVMENMGSDYELLCDSSVLLEFLKSPLIIDILNNYVIYIISGKLENNLSDTGVLKKTRNKYIEESDIINFLADNLEKRYTEAKVLTIPSKELITSFFETFFSLCDDYVLKQLNKEETAMIYFVNSRINLIGGKFVAKLDEIIFMLKQSIQSEIVYEDETFSKNKEYYTKVLKDNHKIAHIYLLDKFDIDKFYVPPFLKQSEERTQRVNFRYARRNAIFRIGMYENSYSDTRFDYWKYIFDRSNIVYVTGGGCRLWQIIIYEKID